MRPSQKSNRGRGRGNRRPNGSNINRVFESTGPEGKVRGTPQQIMDKYLSLARDSQTLDNRVAAESFFQHAEHYHRLIEEAMNSRQERRDAPQPDQDRQGGTGADADGEFGAGARGEGQPRDGERRGPGRAPRKTEVSGLTTIDSGQPDTGSLLVDAEELSDSQPRRRRRGQNWAQPEAPAPVEADSQPE